MVDFAFALLAKGLKFGDIKFWLLRWFLLFIYLSL
jgi:hypothetical protein